ncbi:tyrosine-type recombinase/integrase [Halopseudomonas nanhaiensis]|uniref:tyrosine-type recombinase/integrase n=1 Tax=Halopseudomonas nanhaiensis TaxID=2830842 RepID=UPI001CBC3A0F|nr:tyrosine-type recombinase/integrase [Halopseudomonas nanhaiensis]UAW98669.1 tyrosine-type recombinase/integrase [Halopseudomonas nanhaiensis]
MFERKPSGTITATYRYSLDGKRKKVSMGSFKERPKDPGFTLSEIRERAIALARIASEHGDILQHQAELERLARLQELEAERIASIEAAKGTLEDLLLDYIEDRTGKLHPTTLSEMKRVTAKLRNQSPEILSLHAATIRPHHIKELLLPIHGRGAKVMAERVRVQICAAFNYGMKAENVVGRISSKTYALETNPAAAVTVEHTANKGTRALSEAELKQFWTTLEKTDRVGPIITRLFKFVIATAGQRFSSVIEADWSAYDLEQGVVHLFHNKGRGGKAQRRAHPVPLSPRALEILDEVRALNGNRVRPWTNRTDGRPVSLSSLKNAVNRWLASEHSAINGNAIPSFTARDLRRTCTQLMAQHGIDDRLSDELQAHGIGGVVTDHYRNNPMITLPRRRTAMADFDRILGRLLS